MEARSISAEKPGKTPDRMQVEITTCRRTEVLDPVPLRLRGLLSAKKAGGHEGKVCSRSRGEEDTDWSKLEEGRR